jgi:DNA-directed RNA polymerase specialized sigma24 family protein
MMTTGGLTGRASGRVDALGSPRGKRPVSSGDGPKMKTDVQRALREADWEDLGIRLVAYATWKAGNLRWRTGHSWELAGGRTPEDIVSDAIVKVVEGTRRWDPERGPLLAFLQGVVDSLMSHLVESADNRMQQRWADGGADAAAAHAARWEVQDPDAERHIHELRRRLVEAGDRSLLEVVDAIVAGCEPTPRAMAGRLGTSVVDLNNRLKRLRRLAQAVRRESLE